MPTLAPPDSDFNAKLQKEKKRFEPCHARIPGTQNLCTRPVNHGDSHRCSAADVDQPRNLEGVPDTQRWSIHCMYAGCAFPRDGRLSFSNGDAATTAAQHHADSTGHPVKLRATIEFDCGIVRSKAVL